MSDLTLQRLDHVALYVGDRRRSIAWYQDVLGLRQQNEAGDDDWPVFMGELGACIALFQAPDRSERPGGLSDAFHIAFMVEATDFERAQRHLRERDVPFNFEDHGVAQSLYFYDPDGYPLELTAYRRG